MGVNPARGVVFALAVELKRPLGVRRLEAASGRRSRQCKCSQRNCCIGWCRSGQGRGESSLSLRCLRCFLSHGRGDCESVDCVDVRREQV